MKAVKLNTITPNPENPRHIRAEQFEKLINSIKSFPKMISLRPIVIDDNRVIVGGNMRYKALVALGYEEIPAEWVKQAKDFTPDELREFIIKDNVGFGEWDWDDLANNWDPEKLTEWGLEIPGFEITEEEPEEIIPDKKTHFSYSNVNRILTTKGVKYFCLYRNNGMDLEQLKENRDNVLPFVFPLFQHLQKNNIRKIALAPPGERSSKNGFHFITEVLNEVAKIYELEIKTPFVNRNNKITLDNEAEGCYICDDIVTRGNTIAKMDSLLPNNGIIILLSNH